MSPTHGRREGYVQTVFWSHLCVKAIVLPRQARDKHRENSKIDLFLQAVLGDAMTCYIRDNDTGEKYLPCKPIYTPIPPGRFNLSSWIAENSCRHSRLYHDNIKT